MIWIVEAQLRTSGRRPDGWFCAEGAPPFALPVHPTRDAAIARASELRSAVGPWRYRIRRVD